MNTIDHRNCDGTSRCMHDGAHIVRSGYRSAYAADKYAATQPAPVGRVYVVRDNTPDPSRATALDVWCMPDHGSWNAPEDEGDPTVYGVGGNGLVWGGYRFATDAEVAADDFKGSDIRTESGRVLVLVDAAGAYRWRLENFPRGTDERD